MKRIADRKTRLWIETSALYRGLPLILEPGTHELTVRQKGRRLRYSVPYAAIYELGAKIVANERRREKLAERGKPVRADSRL